MLKKLFTPILFLFVLIANAQTDSQFLSSVPDSLLTISDTTISDSLENDFSYKGKKGCISPTSSIYKLKQQLQETFMESEKLMLAKELLRGQCMSVEQILDLSQQFQFEDQKLEFVQYAYSYTYDLDNFGELENLFSFQITKDSFLDFASKKQEESAVVSK